MINGEEFDLIVSKYYADIRKIGTRMSSTKDADIPSRVEEMNEALRRIIEIRNIQRKQRGEEE